MANRLHNKIVRKPGGKQKPVPVRIVSEPSTVSMPNKPRGVDKWEAQEALRTLQRAAEIRDNKALMKAAKSEASKQVKALSSIK